MIPSPKLDDRAYDDIVAEAIRLIPRYCPDWTNHNPSDPGITLIELAAWMTDIILYRLNRVPEKNYIAFLNLLGINLRPPQAARALLTFNLVENAEMQMVKEGTAVATPEAADDDTVVFETNRDVVLTNVKLDRVFSYWNETYSDHSGYVRGGGPEGGFEAFGGAERAERFIYLGDARLGGLTEGTVLHVFIGAPEHGGRDMARLLEWEFWNGQRWKDFTVANLEVERGEACFLGPNEGPAEIQPVAIHGIEDLWIRGRLAEIPKSPQETELDTLRLRIEVIGEGLPPDKCLSNLEGGTFITVDLSKNSFPFGKEPKIDCCLYLTCRELLDTPDAEVRIEFTLADLQVAPQPAPSDDLTISWEYFDGRRWRLLGKTGPRGLRPGGSADFNFKDETYALSKVGYVSFIRPRDMAENDVNGEHSYWIRARIEAGDYGRMGNYTLEGDKWVWKDDKPLKPPALKSIAFKYREEYKDARHVLVYNDFRFRDVTEEARTEYTLMQPFDVVPEESPTLYMGFSGKLPNQPFSLYFQMAENLGADVEWETEQRVTWEYYNGSWAPLVVVDQTKGLCESGFVDFVGPDDHQATIKFAEERFWVRARLEFGGYVRPPRVIRILTNTVEAMNVITIREEILGSSDGTPLQSFGFTQGPLLPGEIIELREREPPRGAALDDLGENPVREAAEEDGLPGVWVRWKHVDSFFASGPASRHYTFDFTEGRIRFGDGRRGCLPPEGRNNVIAKRYQIGGGSRGNVNSHTISALSRAIAYVESVTNFVPAGGGADAESVEEAKERAPFHIKSRDRAVTAEDFETMALRASNAIARAKCLPDPHHQGQVLLVVVPKIDKKNLDLSRKLIPSPEVVRYVKRYLDDRRLVGSVLNVLKPRYKEVSLKVTLLRRTVGTSDRLRREIEDKLRRFLHPLFGGRDSKGWTFGRPVLKSDLIHLTEEVPGVDAVDNLQIYDEDKRVVVEQVRLEPDELPHVVGVVVVEKVRDEIV